MSVMLQPVSALFWPMMLQTACCTAFKPSMPSIAAGAAIMFAGFTGDAPDMLVLIPVFIGTFIPPTPCASNVFKVSHRRRFTDAASGTDATGDA